MAKQKLEDLQYLDELLALVPQVVEKYGIDAPRAKELQTEIENLKHRIATHDYEPAERRRQASIARLGKDSVFW